MLLSDNRGTGEKLKIHTASKQQKPKNQNQSRPIVLIPRDKWTF